MFFGFSQTALWGYIQYSAEGAQARWNQGVSWRLDDPASLVGQAPVGAEAWQRTEAGLQLEASGGDTYLSLNFAGQTLPAQRLSLLEIPFDISQANVLRVFHRSRLDGPIAALDPIALPAGPQILRVDLAEGIWKEADGSLSSWGRGQGSIATLRLHPAAAGPSKITIGQVRLLPASGSADQRPALDMTLSQLLSGGVPSPAVVTLPGWSLAPAAWWRTLLDRLEERAPATTVRLDSNWRAPLSPGPWPLLALLPLAATFFIPRARVHLSMLALTIALGLALWPLQWSLLSFMVLAICLAALTFLARPVRPAIWGSFVAWKAAGLWTVVLVAPLLVLRWLPGWEWAELEAPAINFWYPLWAFAQQLLLCGVLWPLSGQVTRSSPWRIVLCAAVFGWAHLPNFELMVLTTALAMIALDLFRRYGALAPLAALHAVAGLAWLNGLPDYLLHSGQVGAHYWS